MCVFQVTGNEALESLLTGSVPELEPDHFGRYCDVFRYEIDSDGGIFSGVELVADVSGYDWALTYTLISHKDDLEFLYSVSIAWKTYLVVHTILRNNSKFYNLNDKSIYLNAHFIQ